MNIEFKEVMPFPLASMQHNSESIWGKNVLFQSNKKNQLNASSGKGKSTFTHLIVGLRNDFEGQILIDGKDTKKFKINDWTELRKNKISVVYQDLQLFNNLTVKENLELKNRLSSAFSEAELKGMLELLEIDSKWSQKCGLLSMGQQQRVAIIRAMCQNFDYLILDEPFSHLDKENAKKSLGLIVNRCKDLNAGFVLTTLGDSYDFTYDYEFKL